MMMDRDIEGRVGGTFDSTPTSGFEDQGVTEKAKDRVRDIAADARHSATEQLETRKGRAADTLNGVARSLRSSGEQLEADQIGGGQYVRQAAEQVERLAEYLGQRDVTEMMDQVEDFARRQPVLFVGGAFAIGVLGARFLNSSRERLDRSLNDGYRRDFYADQFESRPTGGVAGQDGYGYRDARSSLGRQGFYDSEPAGRGDMDMRPGMGYAAAPIRTEDDAERGFGSESIAPARNREETDG
jgi:hypothetical protein